MRLRPCLADYASHSEFDTAMTALVPTGHPTTVLRTRGL